MKLRNTHRLALPPIRRKDAPGNQDQQDQATQSENDQGKGNDAPEKGRTFNQDEVNEIVQRRLAEERRKLQQERDKAEQDAKAEELRKQQKYQELADAEKARADEAEGKVIELSAENEQMKEKIKRYEAALAKYAKQAMEGLSEVVIDLLADRDPVDQLEWLAKNAEKLDAVPRKRGVPPTPSGNAAGSSEEQKREARKSFSRRYSIF